VIIEVPTRSMRRIGDQVQVGHAAPEAAGLVRTGCRVQLRFDRDEPGAGLHEHVDLVAFAVRQNQAWLPGSRRR
jgi:hypothetical protein